MANTAITYACLVVAMHWIPYLLAYTLVYAFGIALGYWMQSRFVFRVPIQWHTAARFPIVYLAQYAVGVVILWLLVEVAGIARSAAALVVLLATVPVGYLLARVVMATHGARASPR